MSGRVDVAVTGIGAVTPYGIGQHVLLDGLLKSRSALEIVEASDNLLETRATLGRVRADVGIPNPPGLYLSRTDRLAVVAAREAWTTAALPAPPLDECPVVVASTVAGLSDVPAVAAVDPAAYYRAGGLARMASYQVSHVADAVAICLGVRGLRIGLSVACASGAMAIALAARLIAHGRASVALAGGSDAISGITLAGFHSLRALDPEPCRPFDRSRAGLNLGEGAGIVVLEALPRARARNVPVLAILRGWALSNDALHPTAPDDEGRGLAASIVRAMERAGVTADDVGYVNAHGTGTPLNDVAETHAYERAFALRSTPIPVSSTKSCTGHTLGAAGAIEAIVAILGLREQMLPPTLRLTDPIETGAVDWVSGAARMAAYRYGMSVSAGFGSSNVSLVFERGQAGSVQ
jgi:3-oxoacyl-[acyl-carrier-protein] synthase II